MSRAAGIFVGEALDSVLTLPANGAHGARRAHVAEGQAALR